MADTPSRVFVPTVVEADGKAIGMGCFSSEETAWLVLRTFLKKSDLMNLKSASIVIWEIDIVGDDADNTKPGLNRTGKVQIDFMPGDPDWMKPYYHSPHEKGMSKDGRSSNYKGTFRNIMLATMAAVYQSTSSEEQNEHGRPLEQKRWIWSPSDGLNWIKREPKPKANGEGYTKANVDTRIDGPYKNPTEIATKFGLDSAEDLYSFETLLAAIKKNYPEEVSSKIIRLFNIPYTDRVCWDTHLCTGVPRFVSYPNQVGMMWG